jgi:phospholipid/cholesterol/gamma-HCH transport system substrate-binding protein
MTTEAKVGAFVIASVLALGSAMYYVSTTQTVRGQVTYNTHLRYAGGLAPGAAVLFGGIKVGQVTAVRPWSQDPTQIEILFAVKSGTPLNQKSTARVGTLSLMTTPALMITTGSNEAGRLNAGDVVPSAESLSLEEIEARAAELAESANGLITDLRKVIPGLTGDARRLLGNLNQISGAENQKRIEQMLVSINTLLDQESPRIAQLTDQISELAKHADSVVVSVEPVVKHVDQTVVDVDNTVTAVREPLTKDLSELEKTLQAAQTVLADVHNVVDTNEGDIGETVRNLRSASENVRVLSDSLKQRPWSLIRTKQPTDRKVPQ